MSPGYLPALYFVTYLFWVYMLKSEPKESLRRAMSNMFVEFSL